MQELIVSHDIKKFQERADEALKKGATVVPGTLTITSSPAGTSAILVTVYAIVVEYGMAGANLAE